MDTLLWRRAGGEAPYYELSFDDDPTARLQIEPARSVFGSGYGLVGRAGTGAAAWTFKHTHILGLTHQRVHVRSGEPAREVGLFKIRTFGSGVLTLAGAERFHFGSPGFASDDRVWKTEAGEQLMRLYVGASGELARAAAVEVESEVRRRPEFALLATLGCYLYILRKGQEAQAARDVGFKTRDWWYDLLP